MIIGMPDIFDAVSEMEISDLDELGNYINTRRLACYRDTYDKVGAKTKDFLAEYGAKGFGLYVCDEYGNRFTLAPIQLKDKAYELAFFHRDDNERCEDYDIRKEDRE